VTSKLALSADTSSPGMKYLDFAPLSRISNFLDHVDLGEYVVDGQLEVYSCKLAGFDKKLSRSLEQDVQASSPVALSASPAGQLTESKSRRTLIYLILTLNHIYPDYDFSQLRAQHFTKERTLSEVEENIDSLLLEVSRVRLSQRPGNPPPLPLSCRALRRTPPLASPSVSQIILLFPFPIQLRLPCSFHSLLHLFLSSSRPLFFR